MKLHGMYQPGAAALSPGPDAALVLHGLSGNFYGSSLNLRLADALVAHGLSVVLGNTRGHDGISSSQTAGRAKTFGAAFEIVDECRHDVAGWIDWLVTRRGHKNILLVGHSLGAIKSLYATAHNAHPAIAGVCGLSATRLCHEQFLRSPGAGEFRTWFIRASELVEEGKEDELMPVTFPFPTWIAAGAYCDKYGPEDRYDWVPYSSKIRVPVLLMFGERELSDNAAFHGLLESATAATRDLKNHELHVVEGADHFYAGVNHRAAALLGQWISRTWPGIGTSR